jgi:hypothetical protein
MAKRQIGTVRELVEAYDGPAKLGKTLKIGGTAVTNWCARTEVPPGWGLGFYLGLKKRGYDVSPRVFGAASWDQLMILPPAPPKSKRAKKTRVV